MATHRSRRFLANGAITECRTLGATGDYANVRTHEFRHSVKKRVGYRRWREPINSDWAVLQGKMVPQLRHHRFNLRQRLTPLSLSLPRQFVIDSLLGFTDGRRLCI